MACVAAWPLAPFQPSPPRRYVDGDLVLMEVGPAGARRREAIVLGEVAPEDFFARAAAHYGDGGVDGVSRERLGDGVVALRPDDLLDEVLLEGHVDARDLADRRGHRPAGGPRAQASKRLMRAEAQRLTSRARYTGSPVSRYRRSRLLGTSSGSTG